MIALGHDITLEIPKDRVVLEEVRQGRRIRDVVDRDDLEVMPAQGGAIDIAPDAAKPVDANLHRHDASPRYWGMLRGVPALNLLDHFDSPAQPAGASDWRRPTC